MAANRNTVLTAALCSLLAGAFLTVGSVMKPQEIKGKLELTSSGFKDAQPIPSRYTCNGKNISPPLAWSSVPPGTQSVALIVDDPDAPTGIWNHWVLFNLPASTKELPEDAVKSKSFPTTAKEGVNDFKRIGYDGPCPPDAKPHRYYFKIYALDISLDVPSGGSRQDVETAMTKHILAQGQLMGTYQRQ